jgi:polysaccharide deacetylase 2 family uncharacterized protein YibQ
VVFAAVVAVVVGVGLGIGLGRVTIEEQPRQVARTAAPAEVLPFEEPARHYAPATDVEPEPSVQPQPQPQKKAVTPQPAAKVVAPKSKTPADDKPAWLKYAALTPATEGRPMIAVVIDDVGHDNGALAKRLNALPPPVTLALLPYVRDLPRMADMFRRTGHELMVHMPMEPTDGGINPGPKALLTGLSEQELLDRLNWNLSRFDGYVGINNHMGSRFTRDNDAMALVLSELQKRGLLFVDSRTAGGSVGDSLARWMGVPWARRDVFLDHDIDAAKIREQLSLTERIAAKRGFAVAIGHPHDTTLDALEQWLPEAEKKGFTLVPITAIVRAHLTG